MPLPPDSLFGGLPLHANVQVRLEHVNAFAVYALLGGELGDGRRT
jgi:hypothetical protein